MRLSSVPDRDRLRDSDRHVATPRLVVVHALERGQVLAISKLRLRLAR